MKGEISLFTILPSDFPSRKAGLQAEQDGVLSVLREFEIDPVQLRRRVRAALGKGSYERTGKVIHRSEECKREVRRVKGEG